MVKQTINQTSVSVIVYYESSGIFFATAFCSQPDDYTTGVTKAQVRIVTIYDHNSLPLLGQVLTKDSRDIATALAYFMHKVIRSFLRPRKSQVIILRKITSKITKHPSFYLCVIIELIFRECTDYIQALPRQITSEIQTETRIHFFAFSPSKRTGNLLPKLRQETRTIRVKPFCFLDSSLLHVFHYTSASRVKASGSATSGSARANIPTR